MSKTELPDLIRIVLENADYALTKDQLHQRVSDGFGYEVSERTLETQLRELYKDDEVTRFKDDDGTRGQPPYCYEIQQEENTDENGDNEETSSTRYVGRRGDFSGDDTYQNLPDGAYWDIVERQGKSDELVNEIKDIAPEIADESPVELLVEMTEWAVNRLNQLGQEIARLLAAGQTEKMQNVHDEYDEFAQWCDGYFREFWRLTPYDDPGQDLFKIPDSNDILDAASDSDTLPSAEFDKGGVEERLETRVFEDSVISRINIDQEVTDAVGTDASVAEIELPSRSRLGMDTSLEIFAGAAALEHEGRRFTDYDFNPADLKQYRGRKAFRRGLIVSGAATPQLGQGELDKSRYAAMDLRQYKETTRVIDGEFDPKPHGDTQGELADYDGPDVMFMDGRVTPLVHQRPQFSSTSIYGELVRQEIREFGRIADYADRDNWHTETAFAGVVKSPALSWFAPLVFWYLETKVSDESDCKRIYRPPIPDVRLPHLLFAGLSEANGSPDEDEIFTTFRALRRFYDHSIPEYDLPPKGDDGELINTDSRNDWMSHFKMVQERQQDVYDAETIELEKFKSFRFAELCANVGTVMCYAGPPNLYQDRGVERMRLPRIEILANPSRDTPEEMHSALSLYAKNNYPDEDHAMKSDDDDVDDIPLVVPGVIVRSDEMAKEVREMLSNDIKQDIMGLVGVLEDTD